MAHPCPCTVERRVQLRIPQVYWQARLTDFEAPLIGKVLAWLRQSNTAGLRLFGPVGTGKTHLAVAIVRHREEQNKTAKFHRFASVYRDCRECYAKNLGEREVLGDLFTTPFLVLDDLGAGGLTDFERRTTLDILDERILGKLPTVITTNWDLDQIAKLMDDRISSRLSGFTHLEIAGKDRRMAGQ